MKRFLAFLPLVEILSLHVTETESLSIESSQLAPRDGQEDLLFDNLVELGRCYYYLEDPEDETHDMWTPSNKRLQNEVCNEWCQRTVDKPTGMCSVFLLNDLYNGKIEEICGGLDKVNKPCVDEATGGTFIHSDVVPYLEGETRAWYAVSQCDCSVSDVIDIFFNEIIVPILVELGEFLCGAVNMFIDIAIEVALGAISAIPGGQAVAGVARTVKAAKTVAENGLEAGSFFNDYLGSGSGCDGNPPEFKMPDDPQDAFDKLIRAPDSLNGEDMRGDGCTRKNRGDCRTLDRQPDVELPVRDDNDNNDDNGNTTRDDEATTDAEPSTTRDAEPSTTTDNEASTTTDAESSTTTDAESSRESTSTGASSTSEPTSTRTDCSGNARRTAGSGDGQDDACEIERPECTGNNTPLCEAQDCKGNTETSRCTTPALKDCKCLLVAEINSEIPYSEKEHDELWEVLEQVGFD